MARVVILCVTVWTTWVVTRLLEPVQLVVRREGQEQHARHKGLLLVSQYLYFSPFLHLDVKTCQTFANVTLENK